MDKEDLAEKLYQTMQAEYDNYLEQVQKMPPKDIIRQAYVIVTKADILVLFEDDGLTDRLTKGQLETACRLDKPLEWLFQAWLKVDSTYMRELRDSMQDVLQSYENAFLAKPLPISEKKTGKDKLTQAPQR